MGVQTGYGRNDDNAETPIAVPVRTELNFAEKTARYKVKRRALVERIEKVCDYNLSNSSKGILTPGVTEEIVLYKERNALDKEQQEQLKLARYEVERRNLIVRIVKLNASNLKGTSFDFVQEMDMVKELEALDDVIDAYKRLKKETEKPTFKEKCLKAVDKHFITPNEAESKWDDHKKLAVGYVVDNLLTSINRGLPKVESQSINENMNKSSDKHPLSKEIQEQNHSQEYEDAFDLVEKARLEYYDRIVGARGNNIKEVAHAFKMLIKQARDIELLSVHHGKEIRWVIEKLNFTELLSDRKEPSQWENLFIKEKDKRLKETARRVEAEDKLEACNSNGRFGKMACTITHAIDKVQIGINTDVMILCHTSQADNIFHQLWELISHNLAAEKLKENRKVYSHYERKARTIYYTDGSCIRIVTDTGFHVLEMER